jgi:hypothetical protein
LLLLEVAGLAGVVLDLAQALGPAIIKFAFVVVGRGNKW